MTTTASTASQSALDRLDWDYVELYVGNAKQAAHYYCTAFGFDQIAYAGPETGLRDRASYVLEQNRLRFVLTSALHPDHDITRHVALHGDGIRDVALTVADAAAAFRLAVERGARPVREPQTLRDDFGSVGVASIATYGDTIHTFVQRDGYRGGFMPGFVEQRVPSGAPQVPALHHIDHCVGNVNWNEMDAWADYYGRVFNFSQLISFDDKDISTEYTALKSKVMSDARHAVKFPINEPAQGRKKSQIEEYLDFYHGAGVQHLAIHTSDIISTIRALRANGVEFLEAPDAYYNQLEARIGKIDEAIAVLRELRILVDRDDRGYMLQLFTKPLQDRPTLFFEIIQRKGSLSFGKGNFKALFVAIEQEQARRGTL